MAEQKIDDTDVPAPRRGARPFAGPGAAPAPARPFLRPAAPVTRPTSAPFVPSGARPALGVAPVARRAAVGQVVPTPEAVDAPLAVASIVSVATAARQPEIAEVVPALQAEIPAVFAPPVPAAADDPVIITAAAPSDPEPRRRPVTSEMVALDAVDAFETAWTTANAIEASVASSPTPSPLDELSLGSGGEGEYVWADEITAAADLPSMILPEPGASIESPTMDQALVESALESTDSPMPAWLADDVVETTRAREAEPMVAWSDAPAIPSAADEVIAPVSSVDATSGEDVWATPAAPEAEAWPETLLAEYAPAIAIPRDRLWETAEPSQPEPSREPIAEVASVSDIAADPPVAVDGRTTAAARVSATLDRLADRVRGGEIDVSSVAPEATDAAVLALVLAALLGGSSSR